MKKAIVVFGLISATILSGNAQVKKVLFIMSAADTILLNNDKKARQTGVFLNEFYLPYMAITKAGYEVDFATPGGVKATIDKESLREDYWEEKIELKTAAIAFWDNNLKFQHPMSLENALAASDQYIGIVIPGGQGLMVDLMYDPNIPKLLNEFASAHKAVGLVCHAPALITTISPKENPFIGYKINSVTPFEEFYIEKIVMKGKPKNRKIAKQLKNIGLKYEKSGPGKDFAIRDRNLVTSQNPYSGDKFNTLYLELLSEFK